MIVCPKKFGQNQGKKIPHTMVGQVGGIFVTPLHYPATDFKAGNSGAALRLAFANAASI
jgi:hypothetical protein